MKPWWPRRREWIALALGVLALLACLWLGASDPRQTLLSYLAPFVFFTGLSVGSLAVAMIQPLSGGAWGLFIQPQAMAAARALPLMAVLALPIVLGLNSLYPWADGNVLAHDVLLRKQAWYLAPAFFVIRSIGYFALWLLFLALFTRALRIGGRTTRIAAPGVIVFALTSLFAATDWLSSLVPSWHSSTFGLLVATGWMLAAAALATLATLLGAPSSGADAADDAEAPLRNDLGNVLLMLVLGFAYLAFMQYLTIWIADLPAENQWYIPRTLTTWRWLAWFLVAFDFVIPFFALLSRRAKRSRMGLGVIAGMLVVAGFAHAWWLTLPTLRVSGFSLRWTDLLAPIGIGSLWVCVYLGQLRVARACAAVSPGALPENRESPHA